MSWKPIATAPMDGTPVLACGRYNPKEEFGLQSHPMTVRWEVYHPNAPGKGLWRDKNGHKMMHLTHWMPLPPSPTPDKAVELLKDVEIMGSTYKRGDVIEVDGIDSNGQPYITIGHGCVYAFNKEEAEIWGG